MLSPPTAGTVPVYFGAADIAEFLPPESFLDGSKLHREDLYTRMVKADRDMPAYLNLHAWRRWGISKQIFLCKLQCNGCAAHLPIMMCRARYAGAGGARQKVGPLLVSIQSTWSCTGSLILRPGWPICMQICDILDDLALSLLSLACIAVLE